MISVVLSVNNEIRNNYLPQVLGAIKNQDVHYELIIVDNASSDATLELCKKYTDIIITLPNSNRAERLNKGLELAKGNIILFHHPVSILPKNSFSKIQAAINSGNIRGGFTHSFDTSHFLLKFTSWYSNTIRVKQKGILYLDHQIFVQTDIAKKIGGFPEVDIFEDTLISYQLKVFASPILLPQKVVTSARRFTKKGLWSQALLNQYMKVMFHLGVGDKKMNKVYEKNEGFNVSYK